MEALKSCERFYMFGPCKTYMNNIRKSIHHHMDKLDDETVDSDNSDSSNKSDIHCKINDENNEHSTESKIPFIPEPSSDPTFNESNASISPSDDKKNVLQSICAAMAQPSAKISNYFRKSLERAKEFYDMGATSSFVKALEEDQRFYLNSDGLIDFNEKK